MTRKGSFNDEYTKVVAYSADLAVGDELLADHVDLSLGAVPGSCVLRVHIREGVGIGAVPSFEHHLGLGELVVLCERKAREAQHQLGSPGKAGRRA